MSQIKIRIHEQQQDTTLAEVEVLGCTVQQISEQLIERWQLSRLAVEALQHKTSPEAEMLELVHQQATEPELLDEEQKRNVKLLLNSPFYPVKLANWLALAAPMGWNHPKTRRVEELIGDLLLQPLDVVVSTLHQNCVLASREHPMPGLLSPAALLLLLPSPLILNYRFGDTTKTTAPSIPQQSVPANQSAAAATSAQAPQVQSNDKTNDKYRDQELFQTIVKRLTTRSETFDSRNQVLDLLQQGVVEGLGLERMLCYHVNYAMRMTPISHRGCGTDEPLTNLTLNLEIPGLFKQLTHKPLTVWVNDDNRSKALAALPERFKAICHPHSFILCSLFGAAEQPLILYADLLIPRKHINPFQLKQFKRLADATSICLKALG